MSINLRLPLLGEMAIFVKVVETGSFSEAARQLGASPSSVSRSISRLEKALATRLLQRTTRKLRLSEGGEEVFKRCQEMVSAARSVMEISGQFTHEAEGCGSAYPRRWGGLWCTRICRNSCGVTPRWMCS